MTDLLAFGNEGARYQSKVSDAILAAFPRDDERNDEAVLDTTA